MSFNSGGGGGISSASDVALSAPATNDLLTYNAGLAKWQNGSLTGKSALATQGGRRHSQPLTLLERPLLI